MKKNKLFRYLGRNGMITSPILLDGINHIDMLQLIADSGKILTNGEIKLSTVSIFVDELEQWTEIDNTEE